MNEFGKLLRKLREKNKETQASLADVLGVTSQMVSKLEMGKNKPSMDILKRLSAHYSVSTQYLLGIERVNLSERKITMLPVIGEIAAGQPIFAKEKIIGHLPKLPETDGEFYLHIRGKSMEPLIPDGANVLIEKTASLHRGNVGAFIVGGESAVIKRYYPDTFGVVLRSDNPTFEPLFFTKQQWDTECRILGKVVKFIMDVQ